MLRLAGPFITCSLALASTSAIAQAGATPPSPNGETAALRTEGREQPASAPSVANELCPSLEQAAAENGLPFDFFVRVIWQESRFNALAVSPQGAQGIAQFMPTTADWRGLSNPFDVSAALKASASYLRDLRARFGNLGLAAAAYNAGPQRVQDWLSARGGLPKETRHYVQIVTGHSADEWTGGTNRANLELPEPMPCREVPKVGFRTAAKSDSGIEKAAANTSSKSPPAGAFSLSAVPPKPLHWRHFNNYRSRTRDFWNRASHSLFNPKSERAVPGIACVSLPTVVPTPKDYVPVSARQAAPAWCSAIDPASVASCYSPSWP
jgi:hypothetical protein